ncbi:formin-binding protein 1-like isoform X1 [Hyalella azteca]|uniref:Formin-binding protein 1-like isoform X1 n=1 Tax=Hyalella azteca TaxID=294128 RepID=A0A8B7N414_HYAAZ|nr:formin-binding protein 1-like isoform X1 [Hyalella azteca]
MVYRCDELSLSYQRFYESKDQWDSVSSHSQKGIDFLETYGRFVKERSTIEADYAKSLRKLVKTFLPKKKEDSEKFTVLVAFRDSIKETGDMAGQHELIAEDLNQHIVSRVHDLIKELKEERKKNLAEGARLQQQLSTSHQQLEKAKKNYEKAFREAEKAQDNYQRADADLNLSRAEVEKTKMSLSIKSQNSEDHKNEYANQLQKTNALQNEHYNSLLPGVMQNFQELDMKRIKDFKNLLIQSTQIERRVYPILEKCLDGIVKAAESIDEGADSEAVIEKYKSGFEPPGDVPFDDLSANRQNGSDGDTNSLPGYNSSSNATPGSHGYPAHRSDTVKGTISAAKLRKRANLFTGLFGSNKHNNSSTHDKEDFSELPPTQRRKKIQQKMEEITSKLNQETAARDALLKMKEVYEANPSLGDPLTITGQLSESYSTIEKLKGDLVKYQTMLDNPEPPQPSPTPPSRHSHSGSLTPNSHLHQANGSHSSSPRNGAVVGVGHGSSPRSSINSHRTSLSDESISRSSHSPESGISLSHNSLHGSETGGMNGGSSLHANPSALHSNSNALHTSGLSQTDSVDLADDAADDSAEFYDLDPLPVIGSCRALFNFDGLSEGSMALAEGDELLVIELDAGDGWTRVRRGPPDGTEGFVPTSYIQVTLNPDC